MKAGRELDALVAEHIFKLRFWKERRGQYSLCVGETYDGREPWKSSRIHRPELYEEVSAMDAARIGFFGQGIKPYSTDIAAAWQVVEKLASPIPYKGHDFTLCGNGRTWTADFASDDAKNYVAEADTAPLAICLAALKACGVEVESPK